MTGWVQQWVTGGGLIDTIIGITLLETAVLLLYHRQKKRGLAPRDYFLNVTSGICLMLALRCTVNGSAWYYIALFLTAAGFAHVGDIAMRLRQREQMI